MMNKTLVKKEPSISTSVITAKFLILLLCFLASINILNIFFLGFHIGGRPYQYIRLDSDTNITAWYSSMLFVIAGLLTLECLKISANKIQMRDKIVFLLFTSLLFFMSCDEIARFHEVVPELLTNYLGLKDANPFNYHPWVMLGGPFLIILFLSCFITFGRLLAMHKKSLVLLYLGGISIITGGVLVEGFITFLEPEKYRFLWLVSIFVEENLEMVGSLLISYSLLIWRDSEMGLQSPALLK